jgi:transposase, IS5 family
LDAIIISGAVSGGCRKRHIVTDTAICWSASKSTPSKSKIGDRARPIIEAVHLVAAKGLKVATGTIVDPTIMSAPSSTNKMPNRRAIRGASDQEGQPVVFRDEGAFRSGQPAVVAMPDNVADSTVLPDLLHGQETRVWAIKPTAPAGGDPGACAQSARFHPSPIPPPRRRGWIERAKNRTKSKVRAL